MRFKGIKSEWFDKLTEEEQFKVIIVILFFLALAVLGIDVILNNLF